MSPEETVSKSPLEKPLHLLTEEDISQLTREDCRRYLKEKGMRRPSWNKSQAIQQVISLKALLETTPDSDAAVRKKLYIPRTDDHLPRVPQGTIADAEISVSADELVPNQQKDPEKHDVSGDLSGDLDAADDDSAPPRTTGAATGQVGQMTIFYCGKVNVYDDVPDHKAQAIMQFAASPVHLPQEAAFNGTTTVHSLPCHSQAASVKVGPGSVLFLPNWQTGKMAENSRLQKEESSIFREDNPAEGPASRKASVQRYLEKRKDRFKSKRKVGTPAPGSLDIYLNHQSPNEHSSRSDTCSPPQIGPPNMPTRCGSMENDRAKNLNLSAGLNDKDIQD
ncbi:unnamed protein product [Ilex paraguariensis]|uniref:Protein TIFY n=1 Tax=Ilex paraguariensis TaxID=185542 RepID=A0ABC8QUL8_9AQUA